MVLVVRTNEKEKIGDTLVGILIRSPRRGKSGHYVTLKYYKVGISHFRTISTWVIKSEVGEILDGTYGEFAF